MRYTYDTDGAVCAHSIDIVIDDESKLISEVVFHGGCPGNHLGIAALVKGMTPEEAIKRLSGIRCGGRSTSCPAQLAEALKGAAAK